MSFLWHDYETFGVLPRRDRPAQFAAIRTDAELNEIGEPIMLYCQPADDYLPDPLACLITGITPQRCLQKGIPEYQFAAQIEQALAESGTIGVGYNTIRFDDEVTRFLFWRNLIDPYAREWQNQCGRWDLLDVVRTTYALRPDGINWPVNQDGKPSFRLEDLSRANGLLHEAAHDALSDVRATIALARLIREKQPRLFEYCLALHKKERVLSEIGLPLKKPFLHVSGMFPAEHGCISVVWPLGFHPQNKNEILTWDLRHHPDELFHLDAETVRQRLFTRSEELPQGVTRLPIKGIHVNKSPIVISQLKTLSPALTKRWQIDLDQIALHAKLLENAPNMDALWEQVYQREAITQNDIDEDLYGGFISPTDRRLLHQLRQQTPDELANASIHFQDTRLGNLLFRYRARNFPDSLNEEETENWRQHRIARLLRGVDQARAIPAFFEQIDQLSESANERDADILSALYDYAESIAPTDD